MASTTITRPVKSPAKPPVGTRVRTNKWFTPWILVAPALLWLLVFNVWPSTSNQYRIVNWESGTDVVPMLLMLND